MPENPNRADISRRIEKAEKLLQKGKTPDALAEYLLVLKDDPENDNVRQLAADLCLSVNKGGLAVQLLGVGFHQPHPLDQLVEGLGLIDARHDRPPGLI